MKKLYLLFIMLLTVAASLLAQEQQAPTGSDSPDKPNFFKIRQQILDKWGGKIPPPGNGYKVFKRWEHYWEARILPDGSFPEPNHNQREWDQYVEKHPEAIATSPSSANWTSLGPTSSQSGYSGIGRVNCIAFHPTNTNIIWAGTPGGGLWKSTNGGTNWTTNTDNLLPVLSLGVSSIAIDPSNPNTMYIATGDKETSSGDYFPYSAGIMKSTDGGNTWNSTGSFPGIPAYYLVNEVVIHPTNNAIILAATTEFGSTGITGKLYRSTNYGTSWTEVKSGGPFYDIEFKPGSSTFVYAASYNRLFLSTNAGSSWDPVGNPIPNSTRIQIAVSPNDPKFIALVSSHSNRSFNGFYTSVNSGGSISLKYPPGQKNLLNNNPQGVTTGDNYGQGNYDLCIAVSPTNINTIFIGGVNLWKSTDRGLSWNLANYWNAEQDNPGVQTVHADKHCLVWKNNTTLFQGNDGGIYKSTNSGTSWTDISNTLVISQIYRIGVSQSSNKVICGLQDNGTKLRNVSGTWSDVIGGDGMECFINPIDANIMYGEINFGRLYRTLNGGLNWTIIDSPMNPPPPATGTGDWITPWAIDPNDSSTLFAGYKKVWKSTNQGTNWMEISNTLSGNNLTSLAVAPSNSNVIYVSDGTKIWKTTNGGATMQWTELTSLPISSPRISYIAVDPSNANKVYVTLDRYDLNNKVFKSTTGGSSWINITNTLPNVPANCITVQPNGNDVLYLGTDVGIFYRDATMSDWVAYNNGLPRVIVAELECKPTTNKIYAATHGRGLWVSDLYNTTTNNNLTITPSSQSISSSAGSTTVNVASNISWTVSDNATWLTLSPTSGSGNAPITATFTANTGSSARVATITATGGGFSPTATLTQAGMSTSTCSIPTTIQTTNITTTSATFSWTAVSGASSYSVRYRNSQSSSWISTAPSSFTSTSITVNGLLSNTTYEWQVRTNCPNNLSSNWSGSLYFTTATAATCNTPTNLQTYNITQNSVTVSWGSVSGASNYELQTRLSPNGQWSSTNPSTFTSTAITINSLSANTTYEWRVRTNCSNGLSSNWTTGQVFTTLQALVCNTPSGLFASNITQNTAVLNWNPVSGAESYRVQIYSSGAWQDLTGPPITTNNLLLWGLFANDYIQWRVFTNCSNGLQSAPSSVAGFFTATAPVCNGGTIWPSYSLNPTNTWQYVNNMYGGRYSVVNVTQGAVYYFSFCPADYGGLVFDGELYLRTMDGTLIAYNDDYCGSAPKLIWQSPFTGQVQVLLAKYNCLSQTTLSTMAYGSGPNLTDDNLEERTEKIADVRGFILEPAPETAQNQATSAGLKDASMEMAVYPNPASDVFNIQIDYGEQDDAMVNIEVYGPLGNVVWQKSSTVVPGLNTLEVPTVAWPPGVYIVRLLSAQGKQCAQTIYVTK